MKRVLVIALLLLGGSVAGAQPVTLGWQPPRGCSNGQAIVWNTAQNKYVCGSGGITNSAGANVIVKSDGTNVVASGWTDASNKTTYGTNAFNVNSSTGRVGFNTNALTGGDPETRFNVVASSNSDIQFSRWGGAPRVTFKRAGGTFASPTAIAATGGIVELALNGYDGTSFSGNQLIEAWPAAENWSPGHHGNYWVLQNTPIGSTTPVPVTYIDSIGGTLIPWNGSVGPDPCCANVNLPWGWELVKNDVLLAGRSPGSTNQGAGLIYNDGNVDTTAGAFETYTLQLKQNRAVTAGTNTYTNTILGIDAADNTSHQVNQAIEVEVGEGNWTYKQFLDGHSIHRTIGNDAVDVISVSATGTGITTDTAQIKISDARTETTADYLDSYHVRGLAIDFTPTVARDGTTVAGTTGAYAAKIVSTMTSTGSCGAESLCGTQNIGLDITLSGGDQKRAIDVHGGNVYLDTSSSLYIGNTGGIATASTFSVDAATGNTLVGGTLGVNGAATFSGSATVTDFRGTVSDVTTSTATIDNWAPTGIATATTINVSSSTVGVQITGLTGGSEGRRLVVCAFGNANTVTFANQNAGSTAANRFDLAGAQSWQLAGSANECIHFYYTSSRWRTDESYHFPFLRSAGTAQFDGALIVAGSSTLPTIIGTTTLNSGGTALTIGTSTQRTTFVNQPTGATGSYDGTHLEWTEEFMFGTQPGGNIVGTPPYGTFLSINQAGANAGPNVHDASIAAGTRPGLVDCYVGTSSTGRCGFATGVDLLDFGAATQTLGEFVFGEKNVSTSTERYVTLGGFFDTMSSVNPTDGCYFTIDEGAVATNPTTGDTTMPASNAVKIWCASNGTRTGYVLDGTASEDSFTTVAITAGDLTLPNTNMMHFKVVMEGATKAHFWAVISGSWTEVGRITTNIPTGSTRVTAFGINTIKSVGTTNRITTIDYARLAIDLSSVRSP